MLFLTLFYFIKRIAVVHRGKVIIIIIIIIEYYRLSHDVVTLGCKSRRFDCVLKIHKADVPLRPIVSRVNTFAYDLSAYLANILSPLTGSSDFTVNNSAHFVSTISSETILDNEIPK